MSGNIWNWTFKHSKSNIQFLDGILSLADSSRFKVSELCSHDLGKSCYFSGFSVASSQKINGNSFLMQFSENCEIDYCRLESYSESDSQTAVDIHDNTVSFSDNDTELEFEDYSYMSGMF